MSKNFKSNSFGASAIRKLALAAVVGFAVSVTACSSVNAVTITFDAGVQTKKISGVQTKKIYSESGFKVNPARIVNGNCLSGTCLALNKDKSSILTLISGSQFKLTDFWFKLLGEETSLVVDAYNGGNLIHHLVIGSNEGGDDDKHHSNQPTVNFFSLLPNYRAWNNLTKVSFKLNDEGNARIDSIVLSASNGTNPSPVPVPGALPLLLTGMVGMGILGRKLKRAI